MKWSWKCIHVFNLLIAAMQSQNLLNFFQINNSSPMGSFQFLCSIWSNEKVQLENLWKKLKLWALSRNQTLSKFEHHFSVIFPRHIAVLCINFLIFWFQLLLFLMMPLLVKKEKNVLWAVFLPWFQMISYLHRKKILSVDKIKKSL